MYSLFKGVLLAGLKTPEGPPDPPRGASDSVQSFRASPKFLTYQLLVYVLRQVPAAILSLIVGIGMLSGSTMMEGEGLWMVPLGIFIVTSATFGTLLRYWLIRLDYDLRYYILTDRSLRIRQGAWRIEEATFTFANIQNLSIHQGPLERFLGISNLVIETAGGGAAAHAQPGGAMMHKGMLRGIENAQQMRDRIMVLLREYRDAGLGDEMSKKKKAGPLALDPQHLPPQTVPVLRQVRDEARRLVWALHAR